MATTPRTVPGEPSHHRDIQITPRGRRYLGRSIAITAARALLADIDARGLVSDDAMARAAAHVEDVADALWSGS